MKASGKTKWASVMRGDADVRRAVHLGEVVTGAACLSRAAGLYESVAMIPHDKASAIDLAVAFLRKGAGRTRITLKPREIVETEAAWIFNFHHPDWWALRRKQQPYGVRVSVDKRTGKATHYAAIQPNQGPTSRLQRTGR